MHSGEYIDLSNEKPKNTKSKIVIIVTILLEVVLVGCAIIALCIKKTHTVTQGKLSLLQSGRSIIPLKNWNFFYNLSSISTDLDKIDFSKVLVNTTNVTVPHTWNGLDGQDGGDDYARIPCSYQTYYQRAKGATNPIYIEFCGANLKTTVYVNGQKVGRHVGGFGKFRFELTSYLKEGDNLLTVVVDNSNNKEYYPYRADFTFFGGIYRDVNLISVSKLHFSLTDYGSKSLYVIPNATTGEVLINSTIVNEEGLKDVKVRYTIYDANNKVVSTTESSDPITVKIDKPHLWHGLKDPYLYRVQADLLDSNKNVTDTLESHFGFRTIFVNYTGFYLNGEKYQLRGVSRHQDRPNKGWAISNEEEKEDFDLIYEVGANAVRLSHYQQNETVYDYCDEKGMIILCEVPFISQFLNTEKSEQNIQQQFTEMVKQNFNHPCVAYWGLMNEIVQYTPQSEAMLKVIRELDLLVRSLDTTRGTYGVMISDTSHTSELNRIPDIIGYNLYQGWYNGNVEDNAWIIDDIRKHEENSPLAVSEYGADGNPDYHSDKPVRKDYTEEYQFIFHSQFYEIIERKDVWGGFVWNMFDFASDSRDEGGRKGMNFKGLVTYDRKYKKESFYFYKAVWNKEEKFVHVCGSRFHNRTTDTIDVTILTSAIALNTDLYVYNNDDLISIFSNNANIINIVNVNLDDGINLVKAVIKQGDIIISSHEVEFEKVAKPSSS